jgi:membrane protease YdiL (CAAX protease family)
MRARLIGWLVLVGTLTVLNYAARLSGAEPDRDFLYQWAAFAGGLVQYGLMLGIVLWIAARGPARELLALRRPHGWGAAAWRALGILVGVLVLAGVLEPLLHAGEEQGLTPEGWDSSRATPFVANFILAAGFIPVVEELTFRGVGYALLARYGAVFAILSTGVLFGLAHGLLAGLPILAAFGIGLAWLRYRSDSIYPCIAVHALYNGGALLAAVTLGGSGGG